VLLVKQSQHGGVADWMPLLVQVGGNGAGRFARPAQQGPRMASRAVINSGSVSSHLRRPPPRRRDRSGPRGKTPCRNSCMPRSMVRDDKPVIRAMRVGPSDPRSSAWLAAKRRA
jgi:hypothetical protein